MSFEEHICLFLLDRYLGVELLAHGKFIYIYIYIYSSALIDIVSQSGYANLHFHQQIQLICIFINI